MSKTIAVGLEPDVFDAIRAQSGQPIISYPSSPRAYSLDGKLYVESPFIMGKWLNVKNVLFYGYYDGFELDFQYSVLMASASGLSNKDRVRSFPDITFTLDFADKALGLALASRFDTNDMNGRGYIPAEVGVENIKFDKEMVLKWGNRHCGENKIRAMKSSSANDCIVEPFIEGVSFRILKVGQRFWKINYKSEDWRKNIDSTVTYEEINTVREYNAPGDSNNRPFIRTDIMTENLGLSVAGVDFIQDLSNGRAHLLEVNCYPGLEDIPEAKEEFINQAVEFLEEGKEDNA